MASITLITGSASLLDDPFGKLNPSELYYEFWEENINDESEYIIKRDPLPISFFGRTHFNIIQYLGSGKTLMGMHILSEKAYRGENVAANLGLIWHNQKQEDKTKWTSEINTMNEFETLDNCTVLLDDIRSTISSWNSKEAQVVSTIANAGRKTNLDILITAQREIMIPKDIREMATEWIIPVIRIRDMTQWTPDKTGMPIELIGLHFDGSKTFTRMTDSIIGLAPLFQSYSTIQRAIGLKIEEPDKKKSHHKGKY